MPDLTIEIYPWCSQNEYYRTTVKGSKGDTYFVTFDRGEWSCSCPASKFKKGLCKHIVAVQGNKCEHGVEAAWGSPADDWVTINGKKCCPDCGSEVSYVRIGV